MDINDITPDAVNALDDATLEKSIRAAAKLCNGGDVNLSKAELARIKKRLSELTRSDIERAIGSGSAELEKIAGMLGNSKFRIDR